MFPFRHKGRQYFECTAEFAQGGPPWCSVKVDRDGNHIGRGGHWGDCDVEACQEDEATWTKASNFDEDDRMCFTEGKVGDSGKPCVFPFRFEGKIYNSCTTDGSGGRKVPWCATRTNPTTGHTIASFKGDCRCTGASLSITNEVSDNPSDDQEDVDCDNPGRAGVPKLVPEGTYLPEKAHCNNILSPFIIVPPGTNGTAGLRQFPFMALLGWKRPDVIKAEGGIHYACGGSLINRRYVLTAAHCLSSKPDIVALGEHDLTKDCDCDGGLRKCNGHTQLIAVEEAIKHEDYLASSSDWHTPNDIALLRLARPVETGPNIIPVCLPLDPEASKPADAGHATVCGYGRTSPNKRDRGDTFSAGASSAQLLKVSVPISKNCTEVYARAKVTINSAKQMCAGAKDRDSCSGDSGGPLVQKSLDGVNYQVGVVSFGSVKCGNGQPGVYTRVEGYIDWIRKHLRD